MANSEQIAILGQGVAIWNAWRSEHPSVRPDLRDAGLANRDLRNCDLRSARLSGANLMKAKLSRALLQTADLSDARFHAARLIDANLIGANLSRVDFSLARLTRSKMCRANMFRSQFRSAHLSGADFTGSLLNQTAFYAVDLSYARGLNQVVHRGPSFLDVITILSSARSLPVPFLEGTGVPTPVVASLSELSEKHKNTSYHSCFISYSSKNSSFAERLHSDLRTRGIRCWFAPADLRTGDKVRQRIEDSIAVHDKVLLVLSADAITSTWVEDEVESALERERLNEVSVLIPVRLDDAVLHSKRGWAAAIRRQRQIGDFTGWRDPDIYRKALERLIRDLSP